ncbi:SYFA ligase, partial [Neopipo cinnamomea]|nr:SYFA ligase [Neopipo cinnamomea]
FTEMPTDNFVESSFWNFDALFQPQQHPARDQHDTFFLLGGLGGSEQSGGGSEHFGGLGAVWGGSEHFGGLGAIRGRSERVRGQRGGGWRRVGVSHLPLPPQEKFSPVKYFSIDRVFRNESLDATHLAEFHQVEGVVADRGLTLGHLMGTLRQFFTKLGISQLRFKPAYNPYTEPSVEGAPSHPHCPPGLKKWVEVGNSGVFRP